MSLINYVKIVTYLWVKPKNWQRRDKFTRGISIFLLFIYLIITISFVHVVSHCESAVISFKLKQKNIK